MSEHSPAPFAWGLRAAWQRLGLNRSTASLLAAILLIGMGQYLWQPFMPKYIEEAIQRTRGLWGNLPDAVVVVLAVGLFGTLMDFQEGVYYYLGGRIGGALGTRRALIFFSLLPLVGYGILLGWVSPLATYLAIPFVLAYDSFSQPATLTVVGNTLKARHRTMAFSLQAIQRRIPRIIAVISGGALVSALSATGGVRLSVGISALLVLLAVVIQIRLLHSDVRDVKVAAGPAGFGLVRGFHPELKKLLAADIFARVAEGMPRELFVLYAVMKGTTMDLPGFGTFALTALAFGGLEAVRHFTSLLTYVPVGFIASRPGGQKKPFIGLTFFFFALFPLAFWGLGHLAGGLGLVVAYVIAGLREIGEPARKAMITELLPSQIQTTATGVYWSVRSFVVMLAPMVGAVLWLTVGPAAAFICASAVGMLGAVGFSLLFDRRMGAAE
jgi:MFS family permease